MVLIFDDEAEILDFKVKQPKTYAIATIELNGKPWDKKDGVKIQKELF